MEKSITDSRTIKKVVIIGPESTGKSTLSSELAKHYNTTWVKEYAREFIENLNRPYEEYDLLDIAKGQLQAEDFEAQQANKLLICDTNLITIKVWSEYKYKTCHSEILENINSKKYDLYLLTNVDIPWIEDPQREHPNMRKFFYNIYKRELEKTGVPWVDINGENNIDRLNKAIKNIDKIIGVLS
ncbi:MAG: ATP-binding protein [Cyclobacteriaceae bacterium]|nr:ATP-binding protein [Cyclobacteriaceae bacterium]